MLSTRLSRVAMPALVGALLMTVGTAAGKDGRDFAGFYSLTNLTEQDDHVQITISLQLFNYSGADLKHAVVAVRRGLPAGTVLGAFAPIELWRDGREVILTRQFSVPRDEFRRWSGRGQPGVFVVYTDSDGQEWERSAQVSERPTVP